MIKVEIATAMNTIIEKFGYKNTIEVLPDHLDVIDDEGLVFWSVVPKEKMTDKAEITVNDQFNDLFEKSFRGRKGEDALFYHYLNIDDALLLLENKQIRFPSLSVSSDNQEYLELYDQYHLFIPEGYKEGILLDRREAVFTLPFVEKNALFNFESMPLVGSKEVAMGFRVHPKQAKYTNSWDFRNVIYGKIKAFELAKEIQKEVLNQFGKKFIFVGFDKYSRFYKQDFYRQEKEVRLCLDLMLFPDVYPNFVGKGDRELQFDITDIKQGEILVSLKNDLFELELVEVIMQPQLSESKMLGISKSISPEIILSQHTETTILEL